MPLVEVIHATQKAASPEQKRAFMEEVETVFKEVLATPDGRLRIFFNTLNLEDSNAILHTQEETPSQ